MYIGIATSYLYVDAWRVKDLTKSRQIPIFIRPLDDDDIVYSLRKTSLFGSRVFVEE